MLFKSFLFRKADCQKTLNCYNYCSLAQMGFASPCQHHRASGFCFLFISIATTASHGPIVCYFNRPCDLSLDNATGEAF